MLALCAGLRLLPPSSIVSVSGLDHHRVGQLAVFSNTYVEYCTAESFDQMSPTKHSLQTSSKRLGVISGRHDAVVAIRVSDADEIAKRLREGGFLVEGPLYGQADSTGFESVIVIPHAKPSSMPLPIFVQRESNPDSTLEPVDVCKAANSLQLRNIGVATSNLPQVVETWAKLLDRRPAESWIQEDLDAYCVRISLDDHVHIMFCTPVRDGVVSDALRERGDHVFMLNITGSRCQLDTDIYGMMYRLM